MKKILKILYYIVLSVIAVFVLLLIISMFPITGNIKFMIVQSGSMEPAIKTGSVVMTAPSDNYKIGDVISFGKDSKTKTPTTHRIYDMEVIEGNAYYVTKGDANNAPDREEVSKEEVIGKVLISVPYVGYVVDFTKRPIGFVLFIIIPALVIIGDEIKKIHKELKAQRIKNRESRIEDRE